MILHTGGLASGETSTKSNPSSSALFKASLMLMIPSCLPEEDITRTSLAVIRSLVLRPESFFALLLKIKTKRL